MANIAVIQCVGVSVRTPHEERLCCEHVSGERGHLPQALDRRLVRVRRRTYRAVRLVAGQMCGSLRQCHGARGERRYTSCDSAPRGGRKAAQIDHFAFGAPFADVRTQ